jgi:hypothetical protein
MPSTDCYKTVIVNTSGKPMYMSFLGTHGHLLPPNGEMAVYGSLVHAVGGLDPVLAPRRLRAFFKALEDGIVAVKQSESPIYFDETLAAAKQLKVDNGAISVVDPCGEASSAPS